MLPGLLLFFHIGSDQKLEIGNEAIEISSTSISEATATIMIITANNDDQPTSCYQRLQNDRQIAATRGDGGLERQGEEERKRMEGETWREVKGGGR